MWRNSAAGYGRLSKAMHWVVALAVFGLFGLGLWMVDLDYYSRWYRTAPDIHRSVGILLMVLMLVRGLWMLVSGKPGPVAGHHRWETVAARWVHRLLYLLVLLMGLTGYLISTASGGGIDVFNWFTIPSSGEWIGNQEDVAGEIHEWLAYALVLLALGHGTAALKHHVVDRDSTLKRMI